MRTIDRPGEANLRQGSFGFREEQTIRRTLSYQVSLEEQRSLTSSVDRLTTNTNLSEKSKSNADKEAEYLLILNQPPRNRRRTNREAERVGLFVHMCTCRHAISDTTPSGDISKELFFNAGT